MLDINMQVTTLGYFYQSAKVTVHKQLRALGSPLIVSSENSCNQRTNAQPTHNCELESGRNCGQNSEFFQVFRKA